MKKIINKKLVIIISILLIMLVFVGILLMNKTNILERISNTKIQGEDTEPLFSYVVYDNRDTTNIKVLINLNSETGIEYVEYPDGKKLYGNGKNKIAIDYLAEENIDNLFKIKEINKEEISEIVNINNDTTQETTLKINKITDVLGYKEIDIVVLR